MHEPREGTARARYSFDKNGGAIGDIVLSGDAIPKGAVILDSVIEVKTAPDSAAHTATIALRVEGGHDIQEAKKVEEAPWSTTGAKRGGLTATSAPVTTTARRKIIATVATQVLTKGKFTVFVRYLLPHA
jgi:hypothetical protein